MELRIGNRTTLFAHARLAESAVCFEEPIVTFALDDVLPGSIEDRGTKGSDFLHHHATDVSVLLDNRSGIACRKSPAPATGGRQTPAWRARPPRGPSQNVRGFGNRQIEGFDAVVPNRNAALMLAASAIAIGLSRSALNFDPVKTQVSQVTPRWREVDSNPRSPVSWAAMRTKPRLTRS
jgi:hypothetical protein